ncbi:MAG: DUF995 domain-containing protein [Deltaproteobacteria bacterium]|nr:DUF995 domain-containing protein [Deltaproteobacteria bacterium]
MKTVLLLALLLLGAGYTYAQDRTKLNLYDLKAQGAIQLTKKELQALLPNAKVKSMSGAGSTRYWENSLDGKFVASSDVRGQVASRSSQAHGNWSIADNGTYCVLLEWKTSTEQWCRYIFRADDKYFGVKSIVDDASRVYEFSFSR